MDTARTGTHAAKRLIRAARTALARVHRTREHGLLVTAGGADYAFVASKWEGFNPACAGLPGVKGTKGTKGTKSKKGTKGTPGLKGVKGVKFSSGHYSCQIYPLTPSAPSGRYLETRKGHIRGPDRGTDRTSISVDLQSGDIAVRQLADDDLAVRATAGQQATI